MHKGLTLRLLFCLSALLLLPALSYALEPLGPIVRGPDKPQQQEVMPTAQTMTESAPISATGATIAWEENLGTNLNLWDDSYVPIPIGFDFTFYGNHYNQLFVGSNGYVSFIRGDVVWQETSIPSAIRAPRIAPAYSDWEPLSGTLQNVYANLVGEAPHRRLVVTWLQLRGYGNYPPAPNSFQVQLFEGSNMIQFGYKDLYGAPLSKGLSTGLDAGEPDMATTPYVRTATAADFHLLANSNICYYVKDTVTNYVETRQACQLIDTHAPELFLPADYTREAMSAAGALVNFSGVTATDDVDPRPVVTCDGRATYPIGEWTVPIGINTITCTATDYSGNSTSGSFRITVQDTTAPTITCPRPITVPVNTAVTDPVVSSFLGGATATDIVDSSVTISAPTLPLTLVGTHPVQFTAVDDFGNGASCSSSVSVIQITTPPGKLTVPATNSTGAISISWGASTTAGAAYVLEKSINGGAWTEAYSGVNTWTSVNAVTSGSYAFRVKATKSGYADSTYTNGATACVVTLAVAAPRNLVVPATNSTGAIPVSWTGSSTSGATYILEKSFNGDLWEQVYSGATPWASVQVAANGSYVFRVKAIKANFADSAYATAAACTVTLVCSPPKNLSVPATSTGAIPLTWTSSSTPGAVYIVEQSVNGGAWGQITTANTPWTSVTAPSDGSYAFRVRATKAGFADSTNATSAVTCIVVRR